MRSIVLVGLLVSGALGGAAAAERPAEGARVRVEHHLRHVEGLARHFETVLARACPRFASAREWRAYVDGELDHVVTLLAHAEEAWREAKQTGDDGVRRTAKTPRQHKEQARTLIEKFQACAEDNGSTFSSLGLWRRIERDVPQRQAEVALPE